MSSAKDCDGEVLSAIEAVKAAALCIEERHYKWMIDAAIKHFEAEVDRLEIDITRHRAMFHVPHFDGPGSIKLDRDEAINRKLQYIQQYIPIITFLRALSNLVMTVSAINFAEQVLKAMGKIKR